MTNDATARCDRRTPSGEGVPRRPLVGALALLALASVSCASGSGAQVLRTGVDGATPRGAAQAPPVEGAPGPAAGRGAVTVVVVADGSPVAGAPVALLDGDDARRAVTDETGRYRFADLAPRRYRVRALYLGDSRVVCDEGPACITASPAAGEARDVTVTAGGTTEEVFAF